MLKTYFQISLLFQNGGIYLASVVLLFAKLQHFISFAPGTERIIEQHVKRLLQTLFTSMN